MVIVRISNDSRDEAEKRIYAVFYETFELSWAWDMAKERMLWYYLADFEQKETETYVCTLYMS